MTAWEEVHDSFSLGFGLLGIWVSLGEGMGWEGGEGGELGDGVDVVSLGLQSLRALYHVDGVEPLCVLG